jgi:hypothetical protein
MTHNDLPSDPDRDKVQQAGADPLHESGSHGGESGNGQMKPHTEPERTDPRIATTLQGSEALGGENGPTYQTGGTQQDRADEVEERKQDGNS